MADNSQKFVGRNRPPRVQIEYDVEHYGSKTKIQLPFVMGVLSGLSGSIDGKAITPVKPIAEREMLEIDIDNFDDRLKAIKPRVAFWTKNHIRSENDQLRVDLSFTSLKDFSPAAIIKQVEPLRKLLEQRQLLDNLLANMDGKSKAEAAISDAITNNDEKNVLQAYLAALTAATLPTSNDTAEN